MRKLFSFIAAVLFAGSMMADPYTLTFNYYDNTGSDKSSAETTLDGLFDAASMNYVDATADFTIDKVYLGRKYKDKVSGDSIFSNIKFGSSSVAGTLKFALKDMAVDSVIFRAAMYGDSEGSDGFSVNGTAFTLSAGNKTFENLKYVPAGDITALEIVQTKASKGRFYLTSITVYPKQGGVTPPTPEHTYTVAGGSDVLFGTTWAPANTANDMTLVEGLYTWEKTELTLAAGNIEFKVCEDHAWTNCWPSENYQLNIAEAGIYTVTITFNAETKEVAAVATKTGEAVVIPTVAMHGNFLGSWADTENFAVAQDNASASLTLTLAEGNYEFGMRIGGSGNWTANGANLTREAASTSLAEGSGNMHLVADVAGEYTFTYTYETQVLAVTYPEIAPVVTPITCAAVYALEKNAEVALNDVVVTYVNGKNVWVKDATGAMLLYLAANATWSEGDVLAGVEGVVDIYNGLYEVKPNADQAAAVVATPGEAPEPELLTVITDADVNKYIIIEGVTAEGEFVEGSVSNINITMGDATYTLRNNFKNAYTFEAGSTYTVLAIVSYYKTGIQLYFIDAEEEGGQSDLSYDYEPTTVSTFDVTIASVSVKDYVANYGVITFELEDADGAYFAYLELISSTSEPATGIYPINFTEQDGTFYASPGGDDQYDYGCYFGVMEGEYYNPYYMVSGSVEIAEDGMTVNATSYNGSTIKLTYKAPEEAIDNTEVKASAVKFLQNDQLIIEKNGVRYNVNGQQIR